VSKQNCNLNGQGDEWELILTRTLDHPCEEVWNALTQTDDSWICLGILSIQI
jgi:hypothetical protein